MTTLHDQERKLIELLTSSVHRTFANARAAGVPSDVFGDVEAIARSMTAALPGSHVYDQIVGPFYDTTGMTQWWGVSRQAISKAVTDGRLIACQLDGGAWVYPTWQFSDTGAVHSGLLTLWSILRAEADPWTCAVWLRSPQPDFGGRTAVDMVVESEPIDDLLVVARADVQRWTA